MPHVAPVRCPATTALGETPRLAPRTHPPDVLDPAHRRGARPLDVGLCRTRKLTLADALWPTSSVPPPVPKVRACCGVVLRPTERPKVEHPFHAIKYLFRHKRFATRAWRRPHAAVQPIRAGQHRLGKWAIARPRCPRCDLNVRSRLAGGLKPRPGGLSQPPTAPRALVDQRPIIDSR